jgi:Tol biopolymer transport system component
MPRKILEGALLVLLFFFYGDLHPEAVQKDTPAGMIQARGWVVFDSNRAGQFDIYKMRPDGTGVTRLTNNPRWDIYPQWSPDGRRIVFARHEVGAARGQGDIFTITADGREETLLARKGTFPQYTADGKGIIFERDRRKVIFLDLVEKKERLLIPPAGNPFKHQIVKPRISTDGETIIFTTDRGGGWNLWSMNTRGEGHKVIRGCEGTWDHDGSRIFYIAGGQWTGTSIRAAAWPGGKPKNFIALTGSYRHVYFPSVSDDGQHMLFSACPAGQHDHFSANYQIFIKPMDGGPAVRITWNNFTDRWPSLNTKAR